MNALAMDQAQADANRMRTAVFSRLSEAGLSPMSANTLAGVLDFIPGVGEVSAGEDTYRAARSGDYASAGLNALAMAVGAVPVIGDAAARGIRNTVSDLRLGSAYLPKARGIPDPSMGAAYSGEGSTDAEGRAIGAR